MKAIAFLLAVTFAIAAAAQDPKADGERALREIEAFTTMQARTDPHYSAVEELMLREIDAILDKRPPREWAQAVRRRYVALAEAEHAKERDAIRASEATAARTLGTGDAAWNARLAQLEEEVKAGRLGPRLHALRALETARLYHPGNDLFIGWRAAKVSIATAYEMGSISRADYEDRWNKVTASFMDRQAADDRKRSMLEAQIATEELRMQMRHLERLAPRPMLRCSTTTAFGVTETRCR